MKRKILLIALIVASIFALSACKKSTPQPLDEPPIVENVEDVEAPTLEEPSDPLEEENEEVIHEWSLEDFRFNKDSKVLKYTIANASDVSIGYGLSYQLDRIGRMGDWVETGATDELAFIEIFMSVEPGGKVEDAIDLTPLKLTTGTYRIVRRYLLDEDAYIGIIEFSVDELMNYDHFSGVVIKD